MAIIGAILGYFNTTLSLGFRRLQLETGVRTGILLILDSQQGSMTLNPEENRGRPNLNPREDFQFPFLQGIRGRIAQALMRRDEGLLGDVLLDLAETSESKETLTLLFHNSVLKPSGTLLHDLCRQNATSQQIRQLIKLERELVSDSVGGQYTEVSGSFVTKRDRLGMLPLYYSMLNRDWRSASVILSEAPVAFDHDYTKSEARWFLSWAITQGVPDTEALTIAKTFEALLFEDNFKVEGLGKPLPPRISRHLAIAADHISKKDVLQLEERVDTLVSLRRRLNDSVLVDEISEMAGQLTQDGRPIFFTLIDKGCMRKKLLTSLARFGCKLDESSWLTMKDGERVENCSILHAPWFYERPARIAQAVSLGAKVNTINYEGFTPFESFLHQEGNPLTQVANAFVDAIKVVNPTQRVTANLVKLLISRALIDTIDYMHDELGWLPEPYASSTFERMDGPEDLLGTKMGFLELVDRVSALAIQQSSHGAMHAHRLLRDGGSLYHAYLMLVADSELDPNEGRGESPKESMSLVRLIPSALYKYGAETLNFLANAIEVGMDNNPTWHGHHPNESELFALLGDSGASRDTEHHITRALTSISRFIDGQQENRIERIYEPTFTTWKNFGVLTFSHVKLRFDAQRSSYLRIGGEHYPEMLSLLELGGMRRWEDNRKTGNRPYGSVFELPPGSKRCSAVVASVGGENARVSLDASTRPLFGQGFYWVDSPRGTLLIRNSSPVFGRDLMSHTAYYSPTYFQPTKVKELERILSRKEANGFRPILSKDLYYISGKIIDEIVYLQQQLLVVLDEHRRQVFDTFTNTAFSQDEISGEWIQFGGHKSDLFPALVDFLERRKLEVEIANNRGEKPRDPLPVLAFVHPYQYPGSPYYYTDYHGVRRQYLEVTDDVLLTFRNMIAGRETASELERTSIYNFIQQAGFDNLGQLIMLDPKRNRGH